MIKNHRIGRVLYKMFFTKIRQKLCRHKFKSADMEWRNEKGIVVWPCFKCRKDDFEFSYGLEAMSVGTIVD